MHASSGGGRYLIPNRNHLGILRCLRPLFMVQWVTSSEEDKQVAWAGFGGPLLMSSKLLSTQFNFLPIIDNCVIFVEQRSSCRPRESGLGRTSLITSPHNYSLHLHHSTWKKVCLEKICTWRMCSMKYVYLEKMCTM